jgi:hypothetical protein
VHLRLRDAAITAKRRRKEFRMIQDPQTVAVEGLHPVYLAAVQVIELLYPAVLVVYLLLVKGLRAW